MHYSQYYFLSPSAYNCSGMSPEVPASCFHSPGSDHVISEISCSGVPNRSHSSVASTMVRKKKPKKNHKQTKTTPPTTNNKKTPPNHQKTATTKNKQTRKQTPFSLLFGLVLCLFKQVY